MPALLIAGIMVRPESPPIASLDPEVQAANGSAGTPPGRAKRVFIGGREFETWGIAPDKLILRPTSAILQPELQVFWTADGRVDRALSLGRLSATDYRVFTLPEPALDGHGALVVYSIAHEETFGSINLSELFEE